jgi:hypothetical protein
MKKNSFITALMGFNFAVLSYQTKKEETLPKRKILTSNKLMSSIEKQLKWNKRA